MFYIKFVVQFFTVIIVNIILLIISLDESCYKEIKKIVVVNCFCSNH